MALAAAPLAAQGFDNGGFDNGSFNSGGGTPPPPPAPGGGGGQPGGFDQGSFVTIDNGGGGAPPPPPANNAGGAPPPPPPPANKAGGTPPPPPPPPQTAGGGGTPPPPPPPPVNNAGAGTPPPPPGGFQPPEGSPPPEDRVPAIDPQIAALEMRDFGVPPQQQLRQGQFHGPTPTSLPGGRVILTRDLAAAMQSGQRMVVIDVLGGNYGLPNAFTAQALATAGSFNDRIQQQATQWLGQITGGDPSVAIVVYCSDPQCWLSYNGALRAIAAGYRNVFWYRGGLQAWQMAGLPVYPTGF